MVYNISAIENNTQQTEYSERYRSGHNEAVLKTVWVKAHVGSNPTLSAKLMWGGRETNRPEKRILNLYRHQMEKYSSGEEAPLLRV